MPDESTPAELVGGPADGIRKVLYGEPETVEITEAVTAAPGEMPQCYVHTYRRRRVNGIGVRLPSGMFPYDWLSKKELKRIVS